MYVDVSIRVGSQNHDQPLKETGPCSCCHLFGSLVYFGRRTQGKCCVGLSSAPFLVCEEFYTACTFIQGSIPLQGTMACSALVWKRIVTISVLLTLLTYTMFQCTRNFPNDTSDSIDVMKCCPALVCSLSVCGWFCEGLCIQLNKCCMYCLKEYTNSLSSLIMFVLYDKNSPLLCTNTFDVSDGSAFERRGDIFCELLYT